MCAENRLNAILSNYSALRDEILVWTRSELTVIRALFTVLIALVGLSVTTENYYIICLIPIISFIGVYLWQADHCMIRLLSAYISQEIEGKRLPEIIGKTEDGSLWVQWDTFVRQRSKGLRDRGADRSITISIVLWITIVISSYTAYRYYCLPEKVDFLSIGDLKGAYVLLLLNALYVIIGIILTFYIKKINTIDYTLWFVEEMDTGNDRPGRSSRSTRQ